MGLTKDQTEVILRQTFDAVAQQVGSLDDNASRGVEGFERAIARPRAPRRRNRRRAVLVTAALAVVCALGGALMLVLGTGGGTNPRVDTGGSQGPDVPVSNPYAVPKDVNAITQIEITEPTGDPVPAMYQQAYDGSVNGSSVHVVVTLETYPPTFAGRESNCGPAPIRDINGHNGCAFGVRSGAEADAEVEEVVQWEEEAADQEEATVVIWLRGRGLSQDQLLAMVSAAKRSPDGARVSLDPVPAGLHASGTRVEPTTGGPTLVVSFIRNGCRYQLTHQPSRSPVEEFPIGSVRTTIAGYPGAILGTNIIEWTVNASSIRLAAMEGNDACGDLQATAAEVQYLSERSWMQLVSDLGPLVKRS